MGIVHGLALGIPFKRPYGYDKPPLLQGNYIYYRLAPEVPDFMVKNGIRKIDDVGNTVMTGPGTYGQYDGTMASGRSFTLSGNGYVDVPINAVLGSELHTTLGDTILSGDEISTYVKYNETSFDLAVSTTGTNNLRPRLVFSMNHSILSGDVLILEFEATINSGAPVITAMLIGGGDVININQIVVSGKNTITIKYSQDTSDVTAYFDGTQLFDISVTNISVKQIESTQGSVTYFDATTKEFVQETNLPLAPNYRLENGTFGSIIQLHDREFTTDDLDAMTAEPELAIKFGLGQDVLPSGIIKVVEDKVYAATESFNDILFEINYSEGAELLIDELPTAENQDGGEAVFSGSLQDGFTMTQTGIGTNIQFPRWNSNIQAGSLTGKVIKTEYTMLSENHLIAHGRVAIDRNSDYGFEVSLSDIGKKYCNISLMNPSVDILYGEPHQPTTGYTDMSIHTFKISVKEMLSSYLKIQGTYTRNNNTNYGVQTMRLELNDASVPTSVINTHHIKFDGSGGYVDTGIVIDGSQTDFTMMMAFTLPETETGDWQNYVNSSGDENRVYLTHQAGEPLNELLTRIGKFSMPVTFNNSIPIQAMVAVFNHATSQLQVAINGESLSAPFDIVFDGATTVIEFGRYGGYDKEFLGNAYIGEGILSATMEDEAAWQAFWNRVKDSNHFIALSAHPDFRLRSGTDKYGFDLDTNEVIFRNSPSVVANFSFGGYRSERGMITAENYTLQDGNRNWAIPFAKFINDRNLVGARLNDNKIEIVQRKNGSWTTLGTAPAVDGNWAVKIMNGYIEVYVDGDLKLTKNHNIAGYGYFGISGHQWETGEVRLLKNYDVGPENVVTYKSVPVTKDGKKIYKT